MPYVMVDIESDGPIPGDYSMVCFGAVIVEPKKSDGRICGMAQIELQRPHDVCVGQQRIRLAIH